MENALKVMMVSLGCDKNLVDSEVMLGLLSRKGYSFTDDENEADIVLINTCCFIGDAKEESIRTILEMAELKKAGRIKALLVAGCLAQRYREEIQKEIKEVDALVGTTAIAQIAEALEGLKAGERRNYFREINELPRIPDKKRIVTTGGHYAYLKIAEGCNKRCAYCIIPKVRGSFRSVPMEELLEEAGELAAGGVKELILVAQETTLYGIDLYGQKMLPELLRRLCRIEGLSWIRLLYCYPEEITDELIHTIRSEKKICNYLDLPIQHASDRVLKRMGRRTGQKELAAIVKKLRREIPGICLRTTLITGFPGETQEDFEELYRFVNETEFDRLGVFPYSAEEDTPAADMPDQVPEEVKLHRRDELMELQQAIAYEKAEQTARRRPVLDVFIEGRLPEEGVYIGRTYKDAPNVDGYVFLHTDRRFMSGDMAKVRIFDSNEYDLIGETCDEFTK